MERPPSLVSLILESIKQQLVRGEEDVCINELPEHLLEALVVKLPPVGLQNLQSNIYACDSPSENFGGYELIVDCETNGRKRMRVRRFDKVWEALFKLRWPTLEDNQDKVMGDDWQQMYWQTHLQNCLDEAVESAVLPSFDGHFGEIRVPETTLKCIGYEGPADNLQFSKLSYHCQQFGHYARSLRLQSVFCAAETCELLQNSKLQSLVIRWIRTKEQVDGLCKLLMQNMESLTSVEFMYSKLSSAFINALCSAINLNRIQEFSITTSVFTDSDKMSLPRGLVSILLGRSLTLLKFHDDHLGDIFAFNIFHNLIAGCCSLSTLDLSDNNIAGWLRNFSWSSFSEPQSSLGVNGFPRSLRSLNIRGNNLQKEDMGCLRLVLLHMRNLEVLDISDNPIEDDGLRCLVPYFTKASKGCSSLIELRLENCNLSRDGMVELLDTLTTLKRPLNSLSIADNSLGRFDFHHYTFLSRFADSLGKYLTTNVKVLNIGGIGLTSVGFRELQKKITTKLNLLEINISKNRGGLESARFVCHLLSLSAEITMINASYNLMVTDSLTVLCSALKAKKGNLKRLDLVGNLWEYQPDHASILSEFQHNGQPIMILPSPRSSDVPHDDDP